MNKKKPRPNKPGDWICKACKNSNFSWRPKCNRCGIIRGGTAPEGSWTCTQCRKTNCPDVINCYQCRAPKNLGGAVSNNYGQTQGHGQVYQPNHPNAFTDNSNNPSMWTPGSGNNYVNHKANPYQYVNGPTDNISYNSTFPSQWPNQSNGSSLTVPQQQFGVEFGAFQQSSISNFAPQQSSILNSETQETSCAGIVTRQQTGPNFASQQQPSSGIGAPQHISTSNFGSQQPSVIEAPQQIVAPNFGSQQQPSGIGAHQQISGSNTLQPVNNLDSSSITKLFDAFAQVRYDSLQIQGENQSSGLRIDYEKELKSRDWKRLYGKIPTFEQYEQYISRKNSVKWQEIYGREPEFLDFVSFQLELESKDWIGLCHIIPTFQDYMEFMQKKDLPDLTHDCDIKPTFKDFIEYFKVGNGGQVWSSTCRKQVTFGDFLKFANEVEKHDWTEYCPNLGHPSYRDYLLYTDFVESRDLMSIFGKVPSFVEFMEFQEMKTKLDYEAECGIKPSFMHLLEYIEHNKSRDWKAFCGKYPSFKDYLIYIRHENCPNWSRLKKAFNDKPYFTDYMQFTQILASKDWESLHMSRPTFDDFIEYLIFRASQDWKDIIGRMPAFIDYIDYLHELKSQKWSEEGKEMYSFHDFMDFRTREERKEEALNAHKEDNHIRQDNGDRRHVVRDDDTASDVTQRNAEEFTRKWVCDTRFSRADSLEDDRSILLGDAFHIQRHPSHERYNEVDHERYYKSHSTSKDPYLDRHKSNKCDLQLHETRNDRDHSLEADERRDNKHPSGDPRSPVDGRYRSSSGSKRASHTSGDRLRSSDRYPLSARHMPPEPGRPDNDVPLRSTSPRYRPLSPGKEIFSQKDLPVSDRRQEHLPPVRRRHSPRPRSPVARHRSPSPRQRPSSSLPRPRTRRSKSPAQWNDRQHSYGARSPQHRPASPHVQSRHVDDQQFKDLRDPDMFRPPDLEGNFPVHASLPHDLKPLHVRNRGDQTGQPREIEQFAEWVLMQQDRRMSPSRFAEWQRLSAKRRPFLDSYLADKSNEASAFERWREENIKVKIAGHVPRTDSEDDASVSPFSDEINEHSPSRRLKSKKQASTDTSNPKKTYEKSDKSKQKRKSDACQSNKRGNDLKKLNCADKNKRINQAPSRDRSKSPNEKRRRSDRRVYDDEDRRKDRSKSPSSRRKRSSSPREIPKRSRNRDREIDSRNRKKKSRDRSRSPRNNRKCSRGRDRSPRDRSKSPRRDKKSKECSEWKDRRRSRDREYKRKSEDRSRSPRGDKKARRRSRSPIRKRKSKSRSASPKHSSRQTTKESVAHGNVRNRDSDKEKCFSGKSNVPVDERKRRKSPLVVPALSKRYRSRSESPLDASIYSAMVKSKEKDETRSKSPLKVSLIYDGQKENSPRRHISSGSTRSEAKKNAAKKRYEGCEIYDDISTTDLSDSDANSESVVEPTPEEIIKMVKDAPNKYSKSTHTYDLFNSKLLMNDYNCPYSSCSSVVTGLELADFRSHVWQHHKIAVSQYRCLNCLFITNKLDTMADHLKYRHKLGLKEDDILKMLAITDLDSVSKSFMHISKDNKGDDSKASGCLCCGLSVQSSIAFEHHFKSTHFLYDLGSPMRDKFKAAALKAKKIGDGSNKITISPYSVKSTEPVNGK